MAFYYAQSADGGFTWKDNTGKIIADVSNNLVMGIENMTDLPVELPMNLDPRHTGLRSVLDTKNNTFLTFVNHYKPGTSLKKNFLYKRTAAGVWTTIETNLSHLGNFKLVGDNLFVFSTSGISYADRTTQFSEWSTIPFPIKFRDGNANWDVSNMGNGLISLAIQYVPDAYGTPTPIDVFDIKIQFE